MHVTFDLTSIMKTIRNEVSHKYVFIFEWENGRRKVVAVAKKMDECENYFC